MQYSSKLKRIAAQMKKLMEDNDVAGYFAIHTCTPDGNGYSEFVINITPSYSAAEWNSTKDSVKIKGKKEHYNGDAKKRDAKLIPTINMFHHLSTNLMEHGLMLAKLSDAADKTWNSEHTGGGTTSEQEQNN